MSVLPTTIPHNVMDSGDGPARTGFWEMLATVRSRDRLGDGIHFALASLYLAMLPLAPAPAGISFGLLAACAFLRFHRTYRLYLWVLGDLLMWLFASWTAWHAASMLWSADPAQGMKELNAYRVAATPLLLLPVIDRMKWLVTAFLVGVAMQNAVQLGQWFGWYPKKPGDGERMRGLIHPIQTGTMCTAAMCWHLSATLRGSARQRWLSVLGFVVAGFGLVVTGSRGPWLSAAAALALGVAVFVLKGGALRRRMLLFLVLAAVAAAAIGALSGDVIIKRFNETMQDFRKMEKGRYKTDIGYRIASWGAGWKMFLAAPVQGVGAGGFNHAVLEQPQGKDLKNAYHGHSVYVHVLACTGIIGGFIVAALVVLSAFRIARHPPPGPYAEGFLLVMVSWLIAAMFDAYQLNGMSFGLFAFLIMASAKFWRQAPAAID